MRQFVELKELAWKRAGLSGLATAAEIGAYLAAEAVYGAYAGGLYGKEDAAARLEQARRKYAQAQEAERFQDRLLDFHRRLWVETERANAAFRKGRTLELAGRLSDAVLGLYREDGLEKGGGK